MAAENCPFVSPSLNHRKPLLSARLLIFVRYLELGGDDTAYLSSFMNTSNAAICFVVSSLLAYIKRATGSWVLLLSAPVGIRAVAALAYLRYSSVKPARTHLGPEFQNELP